MSNYQEVTIIGRFTADPEQRFLQSGTPVTNFTIATDLWRGGENCPEGWAPAYGGSGWKATQFWRCVAWVALAERINDQFSKGQLVLVKGVMNGEVVNGVMNPRVWQSNDSSHRANYELTVHYIKSLGRGDSAPQEQESNEPEYAF